MRACPRKENEGEEVVLTFGLKTNFKAGRTNQSGSHAVGELCVLCPWGVQPQTGLAPEVRLAVPSWQQSVAEG